MHDPDLIIRTSGEQRLSNYLLWQSAYSELLFTDGAVARLLARGLRGRARGVRGAQAPLRRPMSTARARRPDPRRRRGASDLPGRVLWAVPAVAFAIFIICSGGWIFAVGILVLGVVCLHELCRMYECAAAGQARRLHRARRASRSRRRSAASSRSLLALVAFFPLLFLLALAMPRSDGATMTAGMALTTFGVVWVGLAVAHAVLLRELPHGGGIVVDVLVGTFIGDTGAYLGGRASAPAARAADLAEQDRRGAADRIRGRGRRRPGAPASTRTG